MRFSNIGDTSVGSFTTLLLSINPNLAQGSYPEAWTQHSATPMLALSKPGKSSVRFGAHGEPPQRSIAGEAVS